jgi:hypothetical protein
MQAIAIASAIDSSGRLTRCALRCVGQGNRGNRQTSRCLPFSSRRVVLYGGADRVRVCCGLPLRLWMPRFALRSIDRFRDLMRNAILDNADTVSDFERLRVCRQTRIRLLLAIRTYECVDANNIDFIELLDRGGNGTFVGAEIDDES